MSNEIKLSIGVIIGSLLLIAGIVFLARLVDTPDQVEVQETIGSAQHFKGNRDADITIVEFSDFQCPSCKAADPVIAQFVEDYGDQVNFVYRHFPLPSHDNARPASYASVAAGQQDKFWEVHNWLFENQMSWGEAEVDAEYFYDEFGEELALDREKFIQDYASDSVREIVSDDLAAGRALGVNATPSFFINGEKHAGVLSYDELVELTGVTGQPQGNQDASEPTATPEVESTPSDSPETTSETETE